MKLTLQYIPQRELISLSSSQKIKKILKSVKQDRIILIDSKLKPEEQTELISCTMEEINKKFRGIEICTIEATAKNAPAIDKIKAYLANALGLGGGMTIIGPAHIVKDIKKDPNKIELLTFDKKKRRS